MDVTPFCERDAEEVVAIWNRTAKGRTLFHPLTAAKLRCMILERPGFDPEGFLLVRDGRGVAGGIVVSAPNGASKDAPAALSGLFDRGGHPGRYAQAALDAGLAYLQSRGAPRVRTERMATVDSRDVPLLEFFWLNRFTIPAVYDGVIEQQIADTGLYMACDLTAFRVPAEIQAIEKALIERGYTFGVVRDDEALERAFRAADMPFSNSFAQILKVRSRLEHLVVARHQSAPVGAALASDPGAPSDWPAYGCDCGLFGPIGVARPHRGGVGKVLLFRAMECLQQRGHRRAIIPNTGSILPFYRKSGARIERVNVTMQRPLGPLTLNVR